MLLSRTQKLSEELDLFEKSKELSSKTQDLSKRLSIAKEIFNMLIRVDQQRIFFQQNNILIDLKETFMGLSNTLDSLKDDVSKDVSNILKPNHFWKTNTEKLENNANQVFILNWEEYINDHLPIKDEKELRIWSQIPELSVTARKLQNFIYKVKEIKDRLPTHEDVMLINRIAKEMKKFMEDLDKVGIPDNVSDFLAKASTVGVSLSEMNNELFEWLENHNMKQYCQVKLVYNG